MRTIAGGCIIAALAMSTAFAQAPAQTPVKRNDVCLRTYMIERTRIVDHRTIRFYMRDTKVWENKLPAPCPRLGFDPFAFVTRDGRTCSGQPIVILTTHELCMLGNYEPYTGTPGKKPDHH